MAQLWVANTTKQRQRIALRRSEMGSGLITKMIEIGHQDRIGGDVTSDQIARYIEQLRRYGGRSETEAAKEKGFVGVVYRVDAPVRLEAILGTVEANDDVAQERSDTELERAAATTGLDFQRLEREHPDVRVMSADIEMVEEGPLGHTAVGLEIVPNQATPQRAKPGKLRNRR